MNILSPVDGLRRILATCLLDIIFLMLLGRKRSLPEQVNIWATSATLPRLHLSHVLCLCTTLDHLRVSFGSPCPLILIQTMDL